MGEMSVWLLLIYAAIFFSGMVFGIVIFDRGLKAGMRSMVAAIDLTNSHQENNNKTG